MSASYWLLMDTGGPELVQVGETVGCTYNLTKMLHTAGFPGWRVLLGMTGAAAGPLLRQVAATMRQDPPLYQALNPPNGWGSYDTALEFLDGFAALCEANPKATIGGSL